MLESQTYYEGSAAIIAVFGTHYLKNLHQVFHAPAVQVSIGTLIGREAISETATQELLAIPGLLELFKQNQATPKAQYTSWRTLRSDV
jgi:hypothetical protein